MRRCVVSGALVLACLFAPAAWARSEPENLARVASVFAMEPVTVECVTAAEDPWIGMAWGYVQLFYPVVYLDAYLCAALVDVRSGQFSLKRRAIAVLVLTHEAYHLRRAWSGRASEAETECKAIRHFTYAAQFLGAPYWLAMRLRGHAVKFHERLTENAPEYKQVGCKVPG
jgi:hypothetical protein